MVLLIQDVPLYDTYTLEVPYHYFPCTLGAQDWYFNGRYVITGDILLLVSVLPILVYPGLGVQYLVLTLGAWDWYFRTIGIQWKGCTGRSTGNSGESTAVYRDVPSLLGY